MSSPSSPAALTIRSTSCLASFSFFHPSFPLGYSGRELSGRRLRAMPTLELTDEELRLVRSALTAYLEDFGHEEADILRKLKAIIAKLPPRE